VISERSIVRPAAALLAKYARWEAIVREAAEQCGRTRLPQVAPPLDWAAAVADAAGLRLLPWEAAQATHTLTASLQQSLPHNNTVSILIGPEGGISEQEASLAVAHGWQLVSLGPRILRAETAALAAVAIAIAA
jgi:16S rRNA (uracil1498-N3)-methyltransferase